MRDKVNKPRAFLSYSSQDLAFIERIETDLRKCQIESWRDRTEIRDGRPWLEAIFEEGLPTCDVIIAYFTENSLNSGMVAKEVDAAQIRQLEDSGISFLPYLNQSEIRSRLRLDIQSLQSRVWNDKNYHEILPSVVAEIWRSYMERNISTALLQEKNRRLELEIALKELTVRDQSSTFSSQEQDEFKYIYDKLNALREATGYYDRNANISSEMIKFSFAKLLMTYVANGSNYFFKDSFATLVKDELNETFPERNYTTVIIKQDFTVDLITYGFAELKEDLQSTWSGYAFTPRLYRFRFWLEVVNLSAESPTFEVPLEGSKQRRK